MACSSRASASTGRRRRVCNIHGGIGIFGGGTPDVYIGNSFSSSGVQPVLISTVTRQHPFLQQC